MTSLRLCFTLLSFLLVFSSCSRKPDVPKKQTGSFHSSKYPLRIDFIPGTDMQAKENFVSFADDVIDVSVNLDEEFPPAPDQEGGFYDLLFDINFSTALGNDAFVYVQKHILENPPDVQLGNIPAVQFLESGGSGGFYMLLIPGRYYWLSTSGVGRPLKNLSSLEPKERRLVELTRDMLQRLSWEKPIDQNSQEFKDWKAHILSLIKEAKKR